MKVVVVDDHPLVCEGIKAVLELEEDIKVVGCASQGQKAGEMIKQLKPDIVLVDLRLPGDSGLNIIKMVRPNATGCRFVIFTTYAEPEDINQAMQLGVDGYILKEALPEEMISALRLIERGRRYFDPNIMDYLIGQDKNSQSLSNLTDREKQVLNALASGLSNKEIAGLLYVTEHTVKKHISNILGKLELKDRTQAALYAVSHGIKPGGEVTAVN